MFKEKFVVVFFTLTDRASTVYPVLYVVANLVRGLLDRKRSEEHLPSSNESKRKTQTNKNDKEKGTRIAKYTCQKKIDDGHSIERVWHSASREPSDTFPGSQPCTQTRSIYHIPYSQGVSHLFWIACDDHTYTYSNNTYGTVHTTVLVLLSLRAALKALEL